MSARRWFLVLAIAAPASASASPVDFVRDIQPLLAARCYDCHGPESAKGGLRLTTRELALKGGESGAPAIVPGASTRSELIARLVADDENDVMPQKAERLPPAQIALLRRWIDEGATWPEDTKHWAYVPPVRPALPEVSPSARLRNPIDRFIVARLAREGLSQAPEADRARWLRRVSLDLIGLPPAPAEVAAFLADPQPGAHERVVDRLLASPHFGERWARPWLDLARYADSHGFQRDDLRDLWPYRDWVVRAMNADLPFDRFTLWQVAGDLLPAGGPDEFDQLVATGFHRSAALNMENGSDQEESRVNQVFDRVNTTGAVWLGTTLECAQCHNHKYDPISQRDYYRLYAFFNHTPRETEFASAKATSLLKFTGPFLELPESANEPKRHALAGRLDGLDREIAERSRTRLSDLRAWEEATAATLATVTQLHGLPIADFESVGGAVHRILPDQSVLLTDDAPDRDTYVVTVRTKLTGITGFKLEALADGSLPGRGPGRAGADRPNFIVTGFSIMQSVAGAEPTPVPLVRATASFSQANYGVENLLRPAGPASRGWGIANEFRRDHWARFETAAPVGDAGGATFTFTIAQNVGAARTIGRLRLSALTGDPTASPIPADVVEILRLDRSARSTAQTGRLEAYYLSQDDALRTLTDARTKAADELQAIKGPRTLVMRELPEPRVTHLLKRGSFLDPGEVVTAGTPESLPPPPPRPEGNGPPNRLDLARWLVARENPLVARVTVNRWWAEVFGRGLVATPEDFGVKGDAPTHPDLLDWLAVEFMESGWSMKHMLRLMVLSATYRQSAQLTPELLARDDQNKLLARGPRFRLDAETIRDNALAVAGLLSLKLGGPPVRPYQPPGLWENKVGGDPVTYDVSPGAEARRRGLYTVWKRSAPYPSFMNFDASARTACTVRRSRSNTPLQALTLLNDPVYVEAARGFAKRILAERPGAAAEERIRHAFQLCLARPPRPAEVAVMQRLLAHPRAAGATPAAAELAGWEAVAAALLNLDETITKG